MTTKSYNLVWLSPRFRAQDEPFRQPIPAKTVENIHSTAKKNPNTDVCLWIDSARLTPDQIRWLTEMTTTERSPNLSLRDFRAIPEYQSQLLYSLPDTSPNWRLNKHSLIWRQVDTARLLACLQSDHDQVFYSDADITNLVTDSDEVQRKLEKHGVILSGWVSQPSGYPMYENGLFGFDGRKREFFRALYKRTLKDVVLTRQNGYPTYIDMVNTELKGRDQINTREIVFQADYDGSLALPEISNTYEITSSPTSSTLPATNPD